MEPYYSGRKSVKFWKRINAIKDRKKHDLAYMAGAYLQSAEGSALRLLDVLIKKKTRQR